MLTISHHCVDCQPVLKAVEENKRTVTTASRRLPLSCPHECMPPAQTSQNYIPRVDFIIAQRADEETFRARQEKRDMISVDWLMECAAQRRLVQLKPHHYLNITKKTLQEVGHVCKYGDL